jgi:hypothetical protein
LEIYVEKKNGRKEGRRGVKKGCKLCFKTIKHKNHTKILLKIRVTEKSVGEEGKGV